MRVSRTRFRHRAGVGTRLAERRVRVDAALASPGVPLLDKGRRPESGTAFKSNSRQFSSHSRHRRVVSWWPVPNARPGSIRITRRSGSAGTASQVGVTRNRLPTRSGLKCAFQVCDQSSSAIRDRASPIRASCDGAEVDRMICLSCSSLLGKTVRIQIDADAPGNEFHAYPEKFGKFHRQDIRCFSPTVTSTCVQLFVTNSPLMKEFRVISYEFSVTTRS